MPGDEINNHFESKAVGAFDFYQQEINGKKFLIHCHKEEMYVCKIMSTHGQMVQTDMEAWRKELDGQWSSFKYTEPVTNHNRAKQWVEDVNNRRHSPLVCRIFGQLSGGHTINVLLCA